MIILDIETSGLYPENYGIWQIGAIDSENPENFFIDECRIDDEDSVSDGALLVTGKTEAILRDENKQSCMELLEDFFKWCDNIELKNCICQNPVFDLGFINLKARKYGLKSPLHHRSFDLHSIAQLKYNQLKGNFFIKEDHSEMNLPNILDFCGMKDERRIVNEKGIIFGGKEHNALEDCKITGECFSRIIFGKGLFGEFNKFEIPEYLIK